MTPSVLGRLQTRLEALYRIDTRLEVDAFVVDEAARSRALAPSGPTARRPREQLLVAQAGGEEVSLGLFLDRAAIDNLERHDPTARLSDRNFGDFCLAVEGLSHFIYVALCAAADRPVTALELELQAEVDKFVGGYLLPARGLGGASELRQRLFDSSRLADDLDETERDRYRTASDQAHRYVGSLERRFIARDRLPEMVEELRRFYRLGLPDKLGHIAQAA